VPSLAKLRCGLTGTVVETGSAETHWTSLRFRTAHPARPLPRASRAAARIFQPHGGSEAPLSSYAQHQRPAAGWVLTPESLRTHRGGSRWSALSNWEPLSKMTAAI